MKRNLISVIALVTGLGLAGTAAAQGRHDEKPHNPALNKTTATDAAKVEAPSATGGRHDERPHGMTKKKAAPKKTDAKSAPITAPTPTPTKTPEAKSSAQ
jgi:hypothetical protein